jgi:hypothetical protein
MIQRMETIEAPRPGDGTRRGGGGETALVEVIDLGRRAIGVELEPRWAKLASANIEHAHETDALAHWSK